MGRKATAWVLLVGMTAFGWGTPVAGAEGTSYGTTDDYYNDPYGAISHNQHEQQTNMLNSWQAYQQQVAANVVTAQAAVRTTQAVEQPVLQPPAGIYPDGIQPPGTPGPALQPPAGVPSGQQVPSPAQPTQPSNLQPPAAGTPLPSQPPAGLQPPGQPSQPSNLLPPAAGAPLPNPNPPVGLTPPGQPPAGGQMVAMQPVSQPAPLTAQPVQPAGPAAQQPIQPNGQQIRLPSSWPLEMRYGANGESAGEAWLIYPPNLQVQQLQQQMQQQMLQLAQLTQQMQAGQAGNPVILQQIQQVSLQIQQTQTQLQQQWPQITAGRVTNVRVVFPDPDNQNSFYVTFQPGVNPTAPGMDFYAVTSSGAVYSGVYNHNTQTTTWTALAGYRFGISQVGSWNYTAVTALSLQWETVTVPLLGTMTVPRKVLMSGGTGVVGEGRISYLLW